MLLPGRSRHLTRWGLATWGVAVMLGHGLVLMTLPGAMREPALPPRLQVALTQPAALRAVPPSVAPKAAPAPPRGSRVPPRLASPPGSASSLEDLPAVELGPELPDAGLEPLPPVSVPAPPDFEPGPEWPLSTRLVYRVEGYYRGPVHGDAEVEWLRQGARYQLRLKLGIGPRLAPFALRELSSEGRVSATGLRPERYDERTRIGFAPARHTLLQVTDGRVRWPNGAERPAPPDLQDSASQFGQLAWLLQSGHMQPQAGKTVTLPLALPQALSPWRYEVVGAERAATPLGEATELLHLRPLPPLPPGALAAEVWLAPALSYLPVRLRISQGSEVWLWLHLDAVPLQERAAPQNADSPELQRPLP